MVCLFTGDIYEWKLGKKCRSFGVVCHPFSDVDKYLASTVFSALTGKGEQREQIQRHVNALAKEIEGGTYTPTSIAANLKKHHNPGIIDGKFHLQVEEDKPLCQTDGSHRLAAIRLLIEQYKLRMEAATEEEQVVLAGKIAELNSLPIQVTLYFDGDSQADFLNLQKGKTVDKAHSFSLTLRKTKNEPAYQHAFEAVKILNKQNDSPFHHCIRLDSHKNGYVPISTLCAKGASDLSTSLVGLAKVASSKQPAYSALLVCKAHETLTKNAPTLLEQGKPLTSQENNGTKGSATMLVGLATCLAYRMQVSGHDVPHNEDLTLLSFVAEKVFEVSTEKSFSVQTKRKLMGQFAREYLADLDVVYHDGLPIEFLKILSSSAYGALAIPKEKKVKVKPEAAPKAIQKSLPIPFDDESEELNDPWKVDDDEEDFTSIPSMASAWEEVQG